MPRLTTISRSRSMSSVLIHDTPPRRLAGAETGRNVMRCVRRLRLVCFVGALCLTSCSNSEAEIDKLKADLGKVQREAQGTKVELAKVQAQLDAAAKEAKEAKEA